MECLLNRERVVFEIMELTRLHICEVLKISEADVEVKCELLTDTIRPEILVNRDACRGVTDRQIGEVIQETYLECKEELKVRLYGLKQTRESVLRELHCEPEEDANS